MEERFFLSEEEEKAYQKRQEIMKKRADFVESIEKSSNIEFDEYVPVLKAVYVADQMDVKEYKQKPVAVKIDAPVVPNQIHPAEPVFESIKTVNIPNVADPSVDIPAFVAQQPERPVVPFVKVDEVNAQFVQPEFEITEVPRVKVAEPSRTEVEIQAAEIKELPKQPEVKTIETAFENPEVKIKDINRVIPESVNAEFTMPEFEKIEITKTGIDTDGTDRKFISPEIALSEVPKVNVQSVDKHFEQPIMEKVSVPDVKVDKVTAEFTAPGIKITSLPEVKTEAPDVHFDMPEIRADVTAPKVEITPVKKDFAASKVNIGEMPETKVPRTVNREFKETTHTISAMPKKTVIPPAPTVPEFIIPENKFVVPEKCRELYEKGIEVPDVTKLMKALNIQ